MTREHSNSSGNMGAVLVKIQEVCDACKCNSDQAVSSVEDCVEEERSLPSGSGQAVSSEEHDGGLLSPASDSEQAACCAEPHSGGRVSPGLTVSTANLLCHAARVGSVNDVNRLMRSGASVNRADQFGSTALMMAAGRGHHDVLLRLLREGADVYIINPGGNTALMQAARTGQLTCLMILLGVCHTSIVNFSNQFGETALILATRGGFRRCMQVLLFAGADVNISNSYGCTALIWAAKSKRHDCMRLLIAAGADLELETLSWDTALMCSALLFDIPGCQLLAVAGANVNHRNKWGDSVLDYVSRSMLPQPKKCVAYLVEMCRDVIRQHLLSVHPHMNLLATVPRLGLPTLLVKFILHDVPLEYL